MEQSFLNPARIVDALSIEEGMKIAELGCGTGAFSIEASRRIGNSGKMYAVDVQKTMLEGVRARARMEGLFNIETVWADLEKPGSTKIPNDALDAVLVPNMLFQSQKKDFIFREAYRITKSGGTLLVIDWIPEKAIYGSSQGWPMQPAEMQRIAEGAGFAFANTLQTGSAYHYGLLFKK